jgi:hypothetical protein
MGAPRDVASIFVVRAGRVVSVVRHPDLAMALAAARLDESDEQRGGPHAYPRHRTR